MSQKRYLQIVNFDDQLHYKDKNPIWIKLYCSLLDDYDFAQIADQTKFHAVGLMILAARLNNRLPDDEAWLRQKINANAKINLNLLLEIGFLEPIRSAKRNRKNSFNGCNSKKTQDELSRADFDEAENRSRADFDEAENRSSPEQNRTEENRTEENTTEHNRTQQSETRRAAAASAADAKNVVVVCDFGNSAKPDQENGNLPPTIAHSGSQFSLADCLKYARQSENVKNPEGLANTLFKTGTADALIMAKLYPEQADREQFGEPVKFSDEPCRVCFGAKMADVAGKGFGKCAHCRNERGQSTGREPEES